MTTPSQTVGPYLAIGLPVGGRAGRVPEGRGRDPHRRPACSTAPATRSPTRMIETWQADPTACSARTSAASAARPPTTRARWEIITLKPGRSATARRRTSTSAVFARGHAQPRASRGSTSPTRTTPRRPGAGLACPRTAARRCSRSPASDGYRFDIHLQGEGETVFFARLSCSARSRRAAASRGRRLRPRLAAGDA